MIWHHASLAWHHERGLALPVWQGPYARGIQWEPVGPPPRRAVYADEKNGPYRTSITWWMGDPVRSNQTVKVR